MTTGIHHITAIATNPQDLLDFYHGILGLKLVKKTVNQDDPQTYHLFFGDDQGTPGMDLTFFTFTPAMQGQFGTGMVTRTMLSVPTGSLKFWQQRLDKYQIQYSKPEKNLLGDNFMAFTDWDGQPLALVETSRLNSDGKLIDHAEIDKDKAIRNFYGAELTVTNPIKTETVLTQVLGFKKVETGKTDLQISIYENREYNYANLVFLKSTQFKRSLNSAGTVHHIAFRVVSDQVQEQIRRELFKLGLNATEQIDRYYFRSVYFREPGGILFEIATDDPGFTVDESADKLGESLVLPPFLEDQRNIVESLTHPISKSSVSSVLQKSQLMTQFKYTEFFNNSSKTIVLCHGTGGNESNLLSLLPENLKFSVNIVGLRGNVTENGMNRFFRRKARGSYDQSSIATEAQCLQEFIRKYSAHRQLENYDNFMLIGFSNGANFIYAASILHPKLINNAVLLHPAQVLANTDIFKDLSLDGTKYLVTYGHSDQMIPVAESQDLIEFIEKQGAVVDVVSTDAGHELTEYELQRVQDYISDWVEHK